MHITWLLLLVVIRHVSSNLIMNVSYDERNLNSPIITFTFCVDCPSPRLEGSISTGLLPKYSKSFSSTTAQVVYCVPNLADKPRIYNSHELIDKFVLVDRGVNSLLDKVLKIQNEGASGVIIADDGQCDERFLSCGRIGALKEGGFSAHDDPLMWKKVHIPVILVTSTVATMLVNAMDIERIEVPKCGLQKITILKPNFHIKKNEL